MPHTPLPHTADTGIEATAPTLVALIEELATGMFELMGSPDPCPTGTEVSTAMAAATVEDLVVDSLSELLYLAETEDLHLCHFQVSQTDDSSLLIRAAGIPTPDVESTGPSIKAVTYHQLEVSEGSGGWFARVYFDV